MDNKAVVFDDMEENILAALSFGIDAALWKSAEDARKYLEALCLI